MLDVPGPEIRFNRCRHRRRRMQQLVQSILRDAVQILQFQNAALRCFQEPSGHEGARGVIAATRATLEYLLEDKFEPRFETVANLHLIKY